MRVYRAYCPQPPESALGEGQERSKAKRSDYAEETDDVSHRSQTNRCCTAGKVGDAQGGEEIGVTTIT
jgi:hypothetical protein